MTKGACREGDLRLFECGAIALHIAESERSGEALADDRRLLPRDPAARGRAISWLFAALNSVDPQIGALNLVDLARARPFYEALGFTNNPRFSNATGVAMVWSHAKWQGFTTRPICPAGSSEVSLAVRSPYIHVRIGSPLFSHVLFGVYVGLGWPRRRAKQSCSAGSSGPTRRFGTLGTAEWVN